MLRRELQPQRTCHVPFSLPCSQKPQCCVHLATHHLGTHIDSADCDWGRGTTQNRGDGAPVHPIHALQALLALQRCLDSFCFLVNDFLHSFQLLFQSLTLLSKASP